MHRSRTARMVPPSAVPRLSMPASVLVLLVFASFACGLISMVSVTAWPGQVAPPVAVTAQKSPDAAGLLVAHATADDAVDHTPGRGCSNKPSATEGSPSLRTDSYGTGFLNIARPQATGRLPADRHGTGCAGPASRAPAPIFLSVLRI